MDENVALQPGLFFSLEVFLKLLSLTVINGIHRELNLCDENVGTKISCVSPVLNANTLANILLLDNQT